MQKPKQISISYGIKIKFKEVELRAAWLISYPLLSCFTSIKDLWPSNLQITIMSHILQIIAASHVSVLFFSLLKWLIWHNCWIIMVAVMLKLWLQLKPWSIINQHWMLVYTINVIPFKISSNIIGRVQTITSL